MRRSIRLFTIFLPTIFLYLLIPSSAIGASAPEIKSLRVPPGWIAPAEGYFVTPEDMKTTVEALYTQAEELKIWESAYYAEQTKHKETAERLQAEAEAIKDQINAVKVEHGRVTEGYQKQIRAEKLRGHSPGLGIFAGPMYTTDGSVELGVGIGLVWRL